VLQTLLTMMPQVLFEGLLLGFVYAMIALGYTMVYGVLELINFAHSEIFMIGGVVGVEVFRAMAPTAQSGFVVLFLAIVTGGLVSGLMAVLVERLAYRPLRRRGTTNRLVPLITAIGVSYVLQDLVRLIEALWHNEFFFRMESMASLDGAFTVLGIFIQYKALIVIGVSLAMMLGLTFLVNKTKMGLAMRTVAQDMGTARLMGINPDRVISSTFFIGGGLGGVAGVLFALLYSTINPYSGFLPGIKAFTAAVLGGIGNIPGAMVGGLVLGELETLAGTYFPTLTNGVIGTEYKDIIAFLALILLLLFRPQGLLGHVVKEKV
jgi:branched-chain amino acid transport system permease protein